MVWKLFAASALAVAARDLSVFTSKPKPRPVVASHPDMLEMRDAPINPDWILSGTPRARVAEQSRSVDGAATTAIWECTAGRFRWYFGCDETVVILDGEVHVTAEDGTERTLRKGDIAYFKPKTWAVWEIRSHVRKIAFVRRPFPMAVAHAWRAFKALRGAAGSASLGG